MQTCHLHPVARVLAARSAIGMLGFIVMRCCGVHGGLRSAQRDAGTKPREHTDATRSLSKGHPEIWSLLGQAQIETGGSTPTMVKLWSLKAIDFPMTLEFPPKRFTKNEWLRIATLP